MDAADPTLRNGNKALKARYTVSQTSGVIELVGPVFCNVFVTERLLLNFVDLKVALNRNGHEFCLMASEGNADYRVNPSVTMAHEIALKRGPAIYPIRRVECKSFIIPAGNPSLMKDNVFGGLVPKTFVFGLVESEAFNGAYKKNPYKIQHFNMTSVGLSVNGEAMPFKPTQPSFSANSRFIEAFSTLFCGTGKMYFNNGNDISREEFANAIAISKMQNAIFAFDLTVDMCGSSPHFNTVQRGNLAVDIKFSVAPATAVSLVCYGEFENLIQIDAEGNVVYDYSG